MRIPGLSSAGAAGVALTLAIFLAPIGETPAKRFSMFQDSYRFVGLRVDKIEASLRIRDPKGDEFAIRTKTDTMNVVLFVEGMDGPTRLSIQQHCA